MSDTRNETMQTNDLEQVSSFGLYNEDLYFNLLTKILSRRGGMEGNLFHMLASLTVNDVAAANNDNDNDNEDVQASPVSLDKVDYEEKFDQLIIGFFSSLKESIKTRVIKDVSEIKACPVSLDKVDYEKEFDQLIIGFFSSLKKSIKTGVIKDVSEIKAWLQEPDKSGNTFMTLVLQANNHLFFTELKNLLLILMQPQDAKVFLREILKINTDYGKATEVPTPLIFAAIDHALQIGDASLAAAMYPPVEILTLNDPNDMQWANDNKNLKEQCNSEGFSPLTYAIGKWGTTEDFTIIDSLLKQGADFNGIDSKGRTPLDVAIETQNAKLVDGLQKRGATIYNIVKTNCFFYSSIQTKKYDFVKHLLVSNLVLITPVVKKDGKSIENEENAINILQAAAKVADHPYDFINWLISSYRKHFTKEVIESVIAQLGSMITKELFPLTTHLQKILIQSAPALIHQAVATFEALLADKASNASYAQKIFETNIRLALNGNPNIDVTMERDITALMLAVKLPAPEAVAYLLAQNADPNKADIDGNTAMHHAVLAGNHAVLKVLLARPGTRIGLENLHGRTPLHVAASLGDERAISLLRAAAKSAIDKEAKFKKNKTSENIESKKAAKLARYLDKKDVDGNASLHLAVALGDLKSVAKLLELGASHSPINNSGFAPIHVAYLCASAARKDNRKSDSKKYLSIIETISKKHPDAINSLMRDSGTLLHLVADGADSKALIYLLNLNAKFYLIDDEGKTLCYLTDDKGRTFLHRAIDAEIDAWNNVKEFYTWASGNTLVSRQVLEQLVNTVDNYGNTVLMVLTKRILKETKELEKGVYLRAVSALLDSKKITPLSISSACANVQAKIQDEIIAQQASYPEAFKTIFEKADPAIIDAVLRKLEARERTHMLKEDLTIALERMALNREFSSKVLKAYLDVGFPLLDLIPLDRCTNTENIKAFFADQDPVMQKLLGFVQERLEIDGVVNNGESFDDYKNQFSEENVAAFKAACAAINLSRAKTIVGNNGPHAKAVLEALKDLSEEISTDIYDEASRMKKSALENWRDRINYFISMHASIDKSLKLIELINSTSYTFTGNVQESLIKLLKRAKRERQGDGFIEEFKQNLALWPMSKKPFFPLISVDNVKNKVCQLIHTIIDDKSCDFNQFAANKQESEFDVKVLALVVINALKHYENENPDLFYSDLYKEEHKITAYVRSVIDAAIEDMFKSRDVSIDDETSSQSGMIGDSAVDNLNDDPTSPPSSQTTETIGNPFKGEVSVSNLNDNNDGENPAPASSSPPSIQAGEIDNSASPPVSQITEEINNPSIEIPVSNLNDNNDGENPTAPASSSPPSIQAGGIDNSSSPPVSQITEEINNSSKVEIPVSKLGGEQAAPTSSVPPSSAKETGNSSIDLGARGYPGLHDKKRFDFLEGSINFPDLTVEVPSLTPEKIRKLGRSTIFYGGSPKRDDVSNKLSKLTTHDQWLYTELTTFVLPAIFYMCDYISKDPKAIAKDYPLMLRGKVDIDNKVMPLLTEIGTVLLERREYCQNWLSTFMGKADVSKPGERLIQEFGLYVVKNCKIKDMTEAQVSEFAWIVAKGFVETVVSKDYKFDPNMPFDELMKTIMAPLKESIVPPPRLIPVSNLNGNNRNQVAPTSSAPFSGGVLVPALRSRRDGVSYVGDLFLTPRKASSLLGGIPMKFYGNSPELGAIEVFRKLNKLTTYERQFYTQLTTVVLPAIFYMCDYISKNPAAIAKDYPLMLKGKVIVDDKVMPLLTEIGTVLLERKQYCQNWLSTFMDKADNSKLGKRLIQEFGLYVVKNYTIQADVTTEAHVIKFAWVAAKGFVKVVVSDEYTVDHEKPFNKLMETIMAPSSNDEPVTLPASGLGDNRLKVSVSAISGSISNATSSMLPGFSFTRKDLLNIVSISTLLGSPRRDANSLSQKFNKLTIYEQRFYTQLTTVVLPAIFYMCDYISKDPRATAKDYPLMLKGKVAIDNKVTPLLTEIGTTLLERKGYCKKWLSTFRDNIDDTKPGERLIQEFGLYVVKNYKIQADVTTEAQVSEFAWIVAKGFVETVVSKDYRFDPNMPFYELMKTIMAPLAESMDSTADDSYPRMLIKF